MRYLLVLLLSYAAISQTFEAATIKFVWDPNPEADVAGYNLYARQGTNKYSRVLSTTNNYCSVTFTNVDIHTVYVTAVNTSFMESAPSKSLTVNTKAPIPPSSYRVEKIDITYVAK